MHGEATNNRPTTLDELRRARADLRTSLPEIGATIDEKLRLAARYASRGARQSIAEARAGVTHVIAMILAELELEGIVAEADVAAQESRSGEQA